MSNVRSSSSDPYTAPQEGDAWASEAARLGNVGTQRLLAVETGSPPPEVQEALQLAPGKQVVSRRRLILANDQPVEIAISYYPASIAAGTPLAEMKKIKGGAVRVLAERGYPLDESIDFVTAERPTAEDMDLLDIQSDKPILVVRRVSGPTAGTPSEYAENRMAADRVPPLEYRTRTSTA